MFQCVVVVGLVSELVERGRVEAQQVAFLALLNFPFAIAGAKSHMAHFGRQCTAVGTEIRLQIFPVSVWEGRPSGIVRGIDC